MKPAEAEVVINMMLGADGGCHVCGRNLLRDFVRVWPKMAWIAKEKYEKAHGEPLTLEDA